jgi:hypothetical protein
VCRGHRTYLHLEDLRLERRDLLGEVLRGGHDLVLQRGDTDVLLYPFRLQLVDALAVRVFARFGRFSFL